MDRRHFIIGGGAAALAACSSGDGGSGGEAAEPSATDSDSPSTADSAGDVSTPVDSLSATSTGDASTTDGTGSAGRFVPTGSLITRWAQDPFAFGSYSYLAEGSSPSDREVLRADVGQRLFFAGEATSTDFAATVHGALLEGRAAAARIDAVADDGESVVVIGAGAAGLAAARVLADDGYLVTIVEARDRIGGRVNTDTSLGVAVDIGASWIHGSDGNPLTELAGAAGVETATTDQDDLTAYDSNGDEIDEGLLETVFEGLSELSGDFDDNLGDLVNEAVGELEPDVAAIARYVATSVIEHEEAADIADLTLGSIMAGEEFDGDEIIFPNGYIGVLEPLAAGIDVQTGRIVSYLFHGDSDDDSAEIEFADGTTLEPDRVLVTVPLGVLKNGSIEFEPPLPDDKLQAIERLGMGVLDKVVLRFDDQFWDDSDLIGFVGNEPGLFIEWNNLVAVTGAPMIMGFNAGSVARRVEEQSDAEILESALDALRTMYG